MNYKDLNDNELLYLVQENNEEARTTLLKKYEPIIVNLAAKYYQKNKNCGLQFDDIFQEGVVGFFRAVDNYQEKRNILFYTYAIFCMERQVQVFCRSLNTKKNAVLNNAYYIDESDNSVINYCVADSGTDSPIENNLLQSDFFNQLIIFKNRLAFEVSQVFELRFNGFTYKEIARLLDLTIRQVTNHEKIIRERLKHSQIEKYLI